MHEPRDGKLSSAVLRGLGTGNNPRLPGTLQIWKVPKMEIIRANQAHVAEISKLFDLYRQFYECESDLDLAKEFIADRINNNESVIFAAMEGISAKGFVQLYPSFCSVEAIKIYILP